MSEYPMLPHPRGAQYLRACENQIPISFNYKHLETIIALIIFIVIGGIFIDFSITKQRRTAGVHRTGNLNGKTFPDSQTQFFTTPGHWEDAVLLLEGE